MLSVVIPAHRDTFEKQIEWLEHLLERLRRDRNNYVNGDVTQEEKDAYIVIFRPRNTAVVGKICSLRSQKRVAKRGLADNDSNLTGLVPDSCFEDIPDGS